MIARAFMAVRFEVAHAEDLSDPGAEAPPRGFCAAALLFTTVLSFVTISGHLWLLRAVLGWTA